MRRDVIRKKLEDARKSSHVEHNVEYKLRQLRRAEVDARNLTQSPEWDVYLQQVAALNEADEQALHGLRGSSDTGIYMSPEQCHQLEFERAMLRAKIQARNECVEIPKTILQGSAAKRD